MEMTNQEKPLKVPQLVSYSAMAVPLAMFNMPVVALLPAFYAAEVGLNLTAIGAVFFLARFWDAVTDPIIGMLSDRTRSRWGRRKIWMFPTVPLLMVSAYFLCQPPEGAGVGYLMAALMALYLTWTMIQIPYLSWGAELSSDYQERSKITGFREVGSMVGIILSAAVPALMLAQDDPPIRDILDIFIVSVLILLPIAAFFSARFCSERIDNPPPPLSWRKMFSVVARNKPFLRFITALLIFRTAWSVFDATFLLLFSQYLKIPGGFLAMILLQYLVSAAFAPMVVRLVGRWNKHRILSVSLLAGALFAVSLVTIVQPGVLWQGIAAFAFFGLTNAALWIMPTAIIADTVDYGQLKGGGEDTGIYMAITTLVQKFSLAAGVAIAFPLLDIVGFDATIQNVGAPLLGLKVIGSGICAVMLVLAAALLWNYPIGRHRHVVIRRWLDRRGQPSE